MRRACPSLQSAGRSGSSRCSGTMTGPARTDLGRALCVITGSSRGFGRAIARDMSRLVKPGSALVLTARSAEDLRSLQAELAESEAGRAGLLLRCVAADLSHQEGLQSVVRAAKEAFCEDMDHVVLVNNAGETGHVMSCYVMSCYFMLWHLMLCHVISCHVTFFRPDVRAHAGIRALRRATRSSESC